MFSSAVNHRFGAERAWTEHLTTPAGAAALLAAVQRAALPAQLLTTLGEIEAALRSSVDASTHLLTHQLHLDGRYPDAAVYDEREQLVAVIEAKRRRADDKHIAKLAAHYVPRSGARLGILVAEGWAPSLTRHPAWAVCPAPVVVVLALDTLHEVTYEVAWTHHPASPDTW